MPYLEPRANLNERYDGIFQVRKNTFQRYSRALLLDFEIGGTHPSG